MTHVYDVLTEHRSIRKYKKDPVDEKHLEMILRAAQAAPSSVNGQQWSIILVKDQEKKDKLASLTGDQNWVAEAPVFLVFVADYNRAKLAAKKNDNELKITESVESIMVASVDVGLAAGNAIAVAESLGYGIVPIGGVRREPEEVIELLELPQYVYPIVGLCIGIPESKEEKKPRLPLQAVVHNEAYNKDQMIDIDVYDDIIHNYLLERSAGKKDTNWSKQLSDLYSRVYYPKVYHSLKKQGFDNDK